MPRGDRTGPWGMGPMTGRRAGYCAGFDMPGYGNPGPRRGFGRGFGWRHRHFARGVAGWPGYGYHPAWAMPPAAPRMTQEQEAGWLKAQAADLEEELKQINERLSSLEQE